MILDTHVTIRINNRHVSYYNNIGYNVNSLDIITIPLNDLMKTSHYKINAKCDVCDKLVFVEYRRYFKSFNNGGYYACSNKCAKEKSKNTCLLKYGVDNPAKADLIKEKINNTFIEKYGGKPLQNVDVMNKLKKTVFEKYNVSNVFQSENVKNKSKATNLEKYGYEVASKNSDIKIKTYNTNMNIYGYKSHLSNPYNVDINIEKRLPYFNKVAIDSNPNLNIVRISVGLYTIYGECGHTYTIDNKLLNLRKKVENNIICTVCNPIGSRKIAETNLYNIISTIYDGNIIRNTRKVIYPFELDIYLPELNIAIEYNGVYWHSMKNEDYHYIKSSKCDDVGINLLHIWDFEIFNNYIKDIKYELGILENIEDYEKTKIKNTIFQYTINTNVLFTYQKRKHSNITFFNKLGFEYKGLTKPIYNKKYNIYNEGLYIFTKKLYEN
jgi:hypothetical protein